MPRFNSITDDAEESYQAMRATARRTTAVGEPSELYWLLGVLNGTTRALQQVLNQATAAHRRHSGAAATDGDHAAGREHAAEAARQIRRTSDLLTRVQAHLDAARTRSGAITWHTPEAVVVDTQHRHSPLGSLDTDDLETVGMTGLLHRDNNQAHEGQMP